MKYFAALRRLYALSTNTNNNNKNNYHEDTICYK